MKKLMLALCGLFMGLVFLSSTYMGPSWDVKPREAMDVVARQMAKQYSLKFMNLATRSLNDSEHGCWVLNYTSAQKMTIDQARPLVKAITETMLNKMYSDPLFANNQKMKAKDSKWYTPELKDDFVGFKIAFWDENVDRPLSPYLAQIRLADSKVYYHYADPQTQALQAPVVETFQDLGIKIKK